MGLVEESEAQDLIAPACGCCSLLLEGSSKICKSCGSINHPDCMGDDLLCNMYKKEDDIADERTESHINMVNAAENMKKATRRALPDLNVDDYVTIDVPKVDRGPLDGHLIGQIMEIRNECYKVTTRHGTIKQMQPRSSLRECNHSTGWTRNDDEITIRKAVPLTSNHGGQGGKKCNCRGEKMCLSKRCACRKADMLCNSKCHSSTTCCNK